MTGASGFAGRHLLDACRAAGDETTALVRRPSGAADAEIVADLRDPGAVRAAIAQARPDVVFHLAALASVGRSWDDPGAPLRENPAMALALLDAIRHEAPGARVVAVASGEIYGPPASLPVDEDAHLRPQNPYAVSKAAADLLAAMYHDAHGLDVVRVRAFNHAGPGQAPIYALSSFCKQAAQARLEGHAPRIVTGNADVRRDFTDVRDVVRAYRMLAADAPPGAYNVCSGRAASIRELVALAGRAAGGEAEHVVDPKLVRAHEVMEIRGSHERATGACGWRPEIPIEQTVADTVAWWESQLRQRLPSPVPAPE